MRLADPSYGERSKGIFKIRKLLLMIYLTLLKYHKTP